MTITRALRSTNNVWEVVTGNKRNWLYL